MKVFELFTNAARLDRLSSSSGWFHRRLVTDIAPPAPPAPVLRSFKRSALGSARVGSRRRP